MLHPSFPSLLELTAALCCWVQPARNSAWMRSVVWRHLTSQVQSLPLSLVLLEVTTALCHWVQHAMDSGWMHNAAGKPNLVALMTSAWEASLGVAQLHREGIIHGGVTPATCFLKAARNQRGFVVKVREMDCNCTGHNCLIQGFPLGCMLNSTRHHITRCFAAHGCCAPYNAAACCIGTVKVRAVSRKQLYRPKLPHPRDVRHT